MTPSACYSGSISRDFASLAEGYGYRQRLEPQVLGSFTQEAPCRCHFSDSMVGTSLDCRASDASHGVHIYALAFRKSTLSLEGRASEHIFPTDWMGFARFASVIMTGAPLVLICLFSQCNTKSSYIHTCVIMLTCLGPSVLPMIVKTPHIVISQPPHSPSRSSALSSSVPLIY